MIVFLIIINAIISAAAQVILKLGVNKIGGVDLSHSFDFFIKAATSPYVITGTSLYVISLGLWLMILTKTQVSFAYPIMSLSYVFGVVFAMLFLGEKIVLSQWLGVGCIIIGTYFIARAA